MSKELKNINENVMHRIHRDKIKIRPKAYFIFGSFLAFLGLVSSIILSIFLVGLIRFSLRTHGPMGAYRLDQMIDSFPWWMAGVAALGLILGIWLLRQYDFSYKVNFKMVVFGFIVAIIVAGLVMDMTGLNDRLFKTRKGRGFGLMKQNSPESNFGQSQGFRQWKNNLN